MEQWCPRFPPYSLFFFMEPIYSQSVIVSHGVDSVISVPAHCAYNGYMLYRVSSKEVKSKERWRENANLVFFAIKVLVGIFLFESLPTFSNIHLTETHSKIINIKIKSF